MIWMDTGSLRDIRGAEWIPLSMPDKARLVRFGFRWGFIFGSGVREFVCHGYGGAEMRAGRRRGGMCAVGRYCSGCKDAQMWENTSTIAFLCSGNAKMSSFQKVAPSTSCG